MKRRSLAGLAAAVAVALAGWVPASGKGSRSGVYSETQANEGAQVYAMQCAMCHGTRLEGTVETPGLVGKFVANWAGRPLGDLFDYLARAMPQGSPGKLSPQDNARLVAFILAPMALRPALSPFPPMPPRCDELASILPVRKAAHHSIRFIPQRNIRERWRGSRSAKREMSVPGRHHQFRFDRE